VIQIAIVGDLINPIMVYLDGENDDSTKGFVKQKYFQKKQKQHLSGKTKWIINKQLRITL